MLKGWRDKILENFAELVPKMVPKTIATQLLENNVFAQEDMDTIFVDSRDYKHNNRLILFQLLKKDDSVYNQFLQALEKCNLKYILCSEAHRPHATTVFHQADTNDEIQSPTLKSLSINNNATEDENSNELTSIDTEIDETPSLKVKLAKYSIKKADNIYYTTSEKRGQVLIINNRTFLYREERRGSERDVQCLKSLFEQMNMTVSIHEDNDVSEIKKVIQDFAKFDDYKICDICVVVIMSHGGEKNNDLVAYDKQDNKLPCSWIEDQFTNVICPMFSGKPKVFLYQICRGDLADYAIRKGKETDEEILPDKMDTQFDGNQVIESDSGSIFQHQRRLEDILVGYATLKGRKAHRDPCSGSWYIQEICRVFSEKACSTDIVEMLNEVDRNMQLMTTGHYTMQTTSYISKGFNKLLYFNPGLYIDGSGNEKKFAK